LSTVDAGLPRRWCLFQQQLIPVDRCKEWMLFDIVNAIFTTTQSQIWVFDQELHCANRPSSITASQYKSESCLVQAMNQTASGMG
jgi:hypothetical protein